MALMQQAAQARTDAGLWGSENEWEDDFLPTQGEKRRPEPDGATIRRRLNTKTRRAWMRTSFPPGIRRSSKTATRTTRRRRRTSLLHRLSFVFRLTDSTPNLYLASENRRRSAPFRCMRSARAFPPICALTRRSRRRGADGAARALVGSDRARPQNRRDMAVVFCAAAFASHAAALARRLRRHDLFFHLNRIEGIANG